MDSLKALVKYLNENTKDKDGEYKLSDVICAPPRIVKEYKFHYLESTIIFYGEEIRRMPSSPF